jgi:hypothetical protein
MYQVRCTHTEQTALDIQDINTANSVASTLYVKSSHIQHLLTVGQLLILFGWQKL